LPPVLFSLLEDQVMEINNNIVMLTSMVSGLHSGPKNGTSSGFVQDRLSALVEKEAAGGSGAPVTVSLSGLANTNYVKDQLDTIMFSFPPFFPVGSPQRLDLIKGVRGVQEEIGRSAIPPEMKQKLTTPQLTDHATNHEVAAVLRDIKLYKELLRNKGVAPTPEKGKASTKVSLKI
jgi:hypothetical protein